MTCKDYGALPKLWVPLLTNNSSRGGGGQTSNITQLASFIPFLYSQWLLFHCFLWWELCPHTAKSTRTGGLQEMLSTLPWQADKDKAWPVSQPHLNPCLKWKEEDLINLTAVSRQRSIPFKTPPVATRVVKNLTPPHVQPDFNATHTVQPQRRHTAEMWLILFIARDGCLTLGYWQNKEFRLSNQDASWNSKKN